MKLHDVRKDYNINYLSSENLTSEPIALFESWLAEATSSGEPEPTAMVLSTVSALHKPASRVVLLKSVDNTGFVFFTNYNSRKGNHLFENPHASLNFYWSRTERQVRVEGQIIKTSELESDEYFRSRPRESQANACVSPQSQQIASREQLETERDRLLTLNDNSPIIRPLHWGGFRLIPDLIEFWQGRPGRLHDRFEYKHIAQQWQISRLAP
jgi:pyridoxamine 5'-phosphate oxidase